MPIRPEKALVVALATYAVLILGSQATIHVSTHFLAEWVRRKQLISLEEAVGHAAAVVVAWTQRAEAELECGRQRGVPCSSNAAR